MPLVDYPSDSSSDEGIAQLKKKRKVERELPPLPRGFRDLYATPVRTSNIDDPALHGGRQRVIPHVEGNWPSHVYTDWMPSSHQRKIMADLIKVNAAAEHDVHEFLFSELGVPAPLHISLSCSLALQGSQREDFVEDLRLRIDRANIHAFETSAISLRWVANSNQTRWFYILQLDRPSEDELNRLLVASNQTAVSFGFSCLYTNERPERLSDIAKPHVNSDNLVSDSLTADMTAIANKTRDIAEDEIDPFHVSIAWSLSQPPSAKTSESLGDKTAEIHKTLAMLRIPVEAVKVKIGNNIVTIPLKSVTQKAVSKSGK